MELVYVAWGISGFLAYEVVRIYKRYIKNDKDIQTAYNKISSLVIVLLVALVSGIMAYFVAEGIKSAFFVGIGTPAIISRVGEKSEVNIDSNDNVDDIEIVAQPSVFKGVLFLVKDYFEWE